MWHRTSQPRPAETVPGMKKNVLLQILLVTCKSEIYTNLVESEATVERRLRSHGLSMWN